MIFEASKSEMRPQHSTSSFSLLSSEESNDSSSVSAQDSNASPNRPPPAPMANHTGTFAIAWQTYTGNGTNGYSLLNPLNGILNQRVMINGATTNGFEPLPQMDLGCLFFAGEMQRASWKLGLSPKHDYTLLRSDLVGSGSPFNNVDIAYIALHGCYGTTVDNNYGGLKEIYFPIVYGDCKNCGNWLAISDMQLGGPSRTNGLKWVVLDACNSLYHVNWPNIAATGQKPFNNNLHMILGLDTAKTVAGGVGERFARYATVGDPSQGMPVLPIRKAWFQALSDTYHKDAVISPVSPTIGAVAYDANCRGDYLTANPTTSLSGSWSYETVQVFPAVYDYRNDNP